MNKEELHKANDLEAIYDDWFQVQSIIHDTKEVAMRFAAYYHLHQTKKMLQLLKIAKCPCCDGSGVIPVETIRVGYGGPDEYGEPIPVPIQDWEPSPCQWCDERDELLKQLEG